MRLVRHGCFASLVACGGEDPAASEGTSSGSGGEGGAANAGGATASGGMNGGGGATASGTGGSAGRKPGNFSERCAAEGVVRCVGFDAAGDIDGTYGDNHGILEGATTPVLDASLKASGQSSIKFTIPSNSGADTSGAFFANFSDDLSLQLDGGEEFFVQWRQRFSKEFIETEYAGANGFKQVIIGTGDHPGCTSSNSANGQCFSSCSSLEVVVASYQQKGLPTMYNSCSGSASHGAYDGFYEPVANNDFLLQNARPDPGCRYSQSGTSYFPPSGNCMGYRADEWMTFQVGITLGPRQGDEFVGSRVRMWVAAEGGASELAIDWGPYNLSAGQPSENERFGKVWFTPYNTGKDGSVAYPEAYTWYDELIVSRQPIGDPL